MNDYSRVASMIRFLDENHPEQPSLSDLATVCGLSESHFHRLFRRWAGITPKDFLQCLTIEHAKRRLRESASVLDAAVESGLSGPGRLHDLFVTIEAASPGEFKSGGKQTTITWGFIDSPFGGCSIGWTSRGVCHLAFHDALGATGEPAELRQNWPEANLSRNDREARRWKDRIFGRPQPGAGPLKTVVRATQFQLKVWRALVRIPEGCLASYQMIADAIGAPNAARAVGKACGANPVGYLIPCHRVIRETGVVKGYRWGDARKCAMLAREGRRRETASL